MESRVGVLRSYGCRARVSLVMTHGYQPVTNADMSQEHLMDAAPEEVNPYTPGSGQIGEEHADQDATIALLRDQLKEAEIQRLRALLEAANAANAAMAGPNGTDGRKPRPRIPDPVRFQGDRSEWLSWRTMMAAKLKVDHAAIGSLSDQFVYIYSRLEGNAWKNITTFVNTHADDGTPKSLISYLDRIYGDPNAQSRAARTLYDMKQGEKQPFAKFLPLLEKTFAEAGALSWPDDAKVPLLLKALNNTMKTA